MSKKVILLGLDGLGSHNLIRAVNISNFDFLRREGMWSLETRIDPRSSKSGPNWVGMLTGCNSYWSGVVDNTCVLPTCPVIMDTLNEMGHKVAISSQWHIIECYSRHTPLYIDEDVLHTDMSRLMKIIDGNYSFIFIHIDNMDYYGHAIGGGSNRFNEEVSNVDKNIVEPLLDYVKMHDDVTLLVTADHGHDLDTSSHSSVDYPVPFFAYGAGIKKGKIETYIKNTDIYYIIRRLLDI